MSMAPAASGRRRSPCRRMGRVEHRPAFGRRDHSERIGPASAVSVVPSIGSTAMSTSAARRAVLSQGEEHRRFVLLATRVDEAVHGHAGQLVPHGVGGRAISRLLVAAAHEPGRGDRRLGGAYELQGQVAVGVLR